MEKKDLVEGMRLYIYKLRVDGRYSTAKSYQDALNSFMRFCGLEVIPYIYVNKENLRRYQAFLLNKGCTWNTVSTYPTLFIVDSFQVIKTDMGTI